MATLTRKHFERVASILRAHHDTADTDAQQDTVESVASELAWYFAELNGHFDRRRFLSAATGKAEV